MTTASPAASSQPGFWSRVWSWMGLGKSSADVVAEEGTGVAALADIDLALEGKLLGGTDPQRQPESGTEAQFVSDFWRLGRDDSSLGQPKELATAVIEAESELAWVERQLQTKRTIDDKKTTLAVLDGRRVRLESDVKDLREWRLDRSFHPLMPPKPLGWMPAIYIAVSIAAFIAEWPLAATLVVNAFDFGTSYLAQAASLGLTFILALFGLAFKILFDVWASDPTSPSNDRKTFLSRLRDHKVGMRIVELAVVALCVWTLSAMADLRAITETVTSLEHANDRLQRQNPDLMQRLADARQRRDEMNRLPMLLLTITLPVFAGLALTTGTSKIARHKHDKEASRAFVKAQTALDDHVDQLARLTAEIQADEARLADETKDEGKVKQAYLRRRLEIYKHGYGRGKVLPEDRIAHLGAYDLHIQALRRLTKRQLRSTFARHNEADGASL